MSYKIYNSPAVKTHISDSLSCNGNIRIEKHFPLRWSVWFFTPHVASVLKKQILPILLGTIRMFVCTNPTTSDNFIHRRTDDFFVVEISMWSHQVADTQNSWFLSAPRQFAPAWQNVISWLVSTRGSNRRAWHGTGTRYLAYVTRVKFLDMRSQHSQRRVTGHFVTAGILICPLAWIWLLVRGENISFDSIFFFFVSLIS